MQRQPASTEMGETEDAKKAHWENIYATKGSTQVSWYAPHLDVSLQLIERTGVGTSGQIIDVGGGASTLVDDLLEKGYENLTVLDISSTALKVSQSRLGKRASGVRWIEWDVTRVDLPQNHFNVWHDRAVFHFLINAPDRKRYLDLAADSLKSGGQLILATFAHDGPIKCSGLDVVRYSDKTITAEAGERFELVESRSAFHKASFNTVQKFLYSRFRKREWVLPPSGVAKQLTTIQKKKEMLDDNNPPTKPDSIMRPHRRSSGRRSRGCFEQSAGNRAGV